MNKKHDRPEYEALLLRIKTGELTRQQAAAAAQELTGLAPSTFINWLSNSAAIKDIKHLRLSAGTASHFASKDPDKVKAYEQAVAAVLAGRRPKQVAAQYGVHYGYLLKKVQKIRPKPPRKTPTTPEEALVAAIMLASRPAQDLIKISHYEI